MKKEFKFLVEDVLITTPEDCWRGWIQDIANDPDVTFDRILVHLKEHVGGHLNQKRFEEWLVGCYNLLAILGSMKGINPQYVLGVDLLYRKWLFDPNNHTPPPPEKTKKVEVKKIHYCGS